MWRLATECRHSFCSQASSPAPQKAHLNCPHSLRCSSTCGSQWSERDPYRTPTKVLGCKRSEPHSSYTRQMQETRRSSICWSTTSTSARIQSLGRPGFHLYRRGFCRPHVCSKRIFSGSRKVWICLFTCLVTRAIHLDIVPDLSATTFIRCLKQFAARRDLPGEFLWKDVQGCSKIP